jgi:predicted porin
MNRHHLLALATLACIADIASAQASSVTIFGVADAAIERIKGATSLTRLQSGQMHGSRWGLRGSEDLGGGLRAFFHLEQGFTLDNGQLGQGGRSFGRQAFVGLGGNFGAVRLGRQYTPFDDVAGLVGTKTYDVLNVARAIGVENNDRLDNTLTYVTPTVGGFVGQLQYSLGDARSTTDASKNSNKSYSAGGIYKSGGLLLAGAYINIVDVDGTVAGDQRRRAAMAVAGYDFGAVRFNVYGHGQGMGTSERKRVVGVNVAAPMGAFIPSIGFAQVKNATGSAADDDANIFTLQARYDLSRRTWLYANLTAVSNDGLATTGANLGFNSPVRGDNSSGVQLGVRHAF